MTTFFRISPSTWSKTQEVFLPICIIGSVFITELHQSDNGVQNLSGLNNCLLQPLMGILIGDFILLFIVMVFLLSWKQFPHFTNPTPDLHLHNLQ
jgi:hypothetical protein